MTQQSFEPAAAHGGDLRLASARYGIPVADWLDLSTGINPEPYPVGALAPTCFEQLPYPEPELLSLAGAYYGSDQILPVAGTQMAIQLLPQCLPPAPLLLPRWGYQEHRLQWQRAGADIGTYPSVSGSAARAAIDTALGAEPRQHLLVINPNNPTGLRLEPEQLRRWAAALAPDCYLIVDEAFIDITPRSSMLQWPLDENVIVLRSFGKFFGLAGIRLGFVVAGESVRQRLSARIGPWAVNGPAQAVAIEALQDAQWQHGARQRIREAGEFSRRLFAPLLGEHQLTPDNQGLLFTSYRLATADAHRLCDFFARCGILLREIPLDERHSLLRIGLLSPDRREAVARVRLAIDSFQDGIEPDSQGE